MYIKELAVLNTVTALGADLNISTDGNTYITNVAESIPSASISNVNIIAPVSAVAGVITVTPTAANSTLYKLTINAWNVNTGLPQVVVLSYTTASSGDSAITICNAFRSQLSGISGLSVTASGTSTLVLTSDTTAANGTTPYVTFSVGGSSGSVTSASSSGSSVTVYPNIAAVRTTQSVVGVGSAAILETKYPMTSNTNINYTQIENLTAGSSYYEVDIQFVTPDSGNASSNSQNLEEVVVLVKSDAANAATLVASWGTMGQLALGYKATIVASGANVDFGSNVATRASGSFITEALVAGDIIAVSDGVTTTGSATVILPYSDGATAANFIFTKAYIDSASTVSAAAAFVVHKTNIPF